MQSIWTHSILYVGRLNDIDDPDLRRHILKFYKGNAQEDHMVIESLLGEGTIVNNLNKYRGEHLRICRPTGLTREDALRVVGYSIRQLGTDYNVRHLLDLARFMFPYGFIPRKWRSTLFQHNAGRPTRTVCSTMMAEAFAQVHFPIRPVLHQDDEGSIKMYRRNSKLITPPDFDYSPYFDVIKYPLLGLDELAVYRKLPWDRTGVHSSEVGDVFIDDTTAIIPTEDEPESIPDDRDGVQASDDSNPLTPIPATTRVK